MPGLVIDATAERTPALSICSRARRGDQLVKALAGSAPPESSMIRLRFAVA